MIEENEVEFEQNLLYLPQATHICSLYFSTPETHKIQFGNSEV